MSDKIRIESVDFFRLLAIFCVIIIHTRPFLGNTLFGCGVNNYLGVFINQISRFAVPFFFTISGYFFALKTSRSESTDSAAKTVLSRVILIFISWSCVYLFPWDKLFPIDDFNIVGALEFVQNKVISIYKNPVGFLFNGTKGHLWFLSSLIQVVIITFLWEKYKLRMDIFYVALLLFIIGNLAFSYSNTPIGVDFNIDPKNGPFFGLLFFVSGFKLFQLDYKINYLKIGVILLLLGVCFHFSEIFILNKYFEVLPVSDYVFGTYFFGIGMTLIALSNNNIFKIGNLSNIGRKTLGIYGIHYIFIDILKPFKMQFCGTIVEILFTIMVFLMSILAVYLMSLNKVLRNIVE